MMMTPILRFPTLTTLSWVDVEGLIRRKEYAKRFVVGGEFVEINFSLAYKADWETNTNRVIRPYRVVRMPNPHIKP